MLDGRDEARRELAALEPVPAFGDDARERLTAALAERTAAVDAAAALRADDEADRRRREELVLDDRLAAVAADVEALSGELAVQRSREQTLEEDRGRRAAAAREVAERLVAAGRRLGRGAGRHSSTPRCRAVSGSAGSDASSTRRWRRSTGAGSTPSGRRRGSRRRA